MAKSMMQEMQERLAGFTPPRISERPAIDPENIAPYLNWIAQESRSLGHMLQHHLTLAELAIRTKANEAQAKATQHTLVEDGVIDPPPQAS